MSAFVPIYIVMVSKRPATAYWDCNDAKKSMKDCIKNGEVKSGEIAIEVAFVEDPAIYMRRMLRKHGLTPKRLDKFEFISPVGSAMQSLAQVGQASIMESAKDYLDDQLSLSYATRTGPYMLYTGTISDLKEDLK